MKKEVMSERGVLHTLEIENTINCCEQGCGVVSSRRFLGGVGFLTTLGVGSFCLTPDVQLDHFLHHTPKLRISF